MGTELYNLGAQEIYGSHQLWSAQANYDSPDLVIEAHRRQNLKIIFLLRLQVLFFNFVIGLSKPVLM